MAELPYFAFYAGDWLASSTVSRLTLEEEGTFIRLLAYGWRMNGIPNDRRELAILLRLRPGSERAERLLSRIIDLAWKPDPDDPRLLRNDRQERERAAASRAYTAQVSNLAKARAANPKNQHPNRPKSQPTPIKTEINSVIKTLIKDLPESQNQNQKKLFAEGESEQPPPDPDAFGRTWRSTLENPEPPVRELPS